MLYLLHQCKRPNESRRIQIEDCPERGRKVPDQPSNLQNVRHAAPCTPSENSTCVDYWGRGFRLRPFGLCFHRHPSTHTYMYSPGRCHARTHAPSANGGDGWGESATPAISSWAACRQILTCAGAQSRGSRAEPSTTIPVPSRKSWLAGGVSFRLSASGGNSPAEGPKQAIAPLACAHEPHCAGWDATPDRPSGELGALIELACRGVRRWPWLHEGRRSIPVNSTAIFHVDLGLWLFGSC